MQDILILLNDPQFEDEIRETLRGKNYIYHAAEDLTAAIKICKEEFIDLILVWPAQPDLMLRLHKSLRQHQFAHTPVLAAVPKGETRLQAYINLVTDIFHFPLPKAEFLNILQLLTDAFQQNYEYHENQAWAGNISEFYLLDILMLISTGQKDGILNISSDEHTGSVFFRHGKIIKATFNNFHSMQALKKMLLIRHGNFAINYTRVDIQDTIEQTTDLLIRELNEYHREIEMALAKLPHQFEKFTIKDITMDETGKQELMIAVLEKLQVGASINDLNVELNYDTLEILEQLLLWQNMGAQFASETLPDEPSEPEISSGETGLWGKISGIFKKKEVPVVSRDVFTEPEIVENRIIQSELIYQHRSECEKHIPRIQQFIQEL